MREKSEEVYGKYDEIHTPCLLLPPPCTYISLYSYSEYPLTRTSPRPLYTNTHIAALLFYSREYLAMPTAMPLQVTAMRMPPSPLPRPLTRACRSSCRWLLPSPSARTTPVRGPPVLCRSCCRTRRAGRWRRGQIRLCVNSLETRRRRRRRGGGRRRRAKQRRRRMSARGSMRCLSSRRPRPITSATDAGRRTFQKYEKRVEKRKDEKRFVD